MGRRVNVHIRNWLQGCQKQPVVILEKPCSGCNYLQLRRCLSPQERSFARQICVTSKWLH